MDKAQQKRIDRHSGSGLWGAKSLGKASSRINGPHPTGITAPIRYVPCSGILLTGGI
jgi:hypothetical protein